MSATAITATITDLYKAKVIQRLGPRWLFGMVELMILEWVVRLNNRRPMKPPSNIPPAEAAARYWVMLDEHPLPAESKRNGVSNP
jgi:hypothetical protein